MRHSVNSLGGFWIKNFATNPAEKTKTFFMSEKLPGISREFGRKL